MGYTTLIDKCYGRDAALYLGGVHYSAIIGLHGEAYLQHYTTGKLEHSRNPNINLLVLGKRSNSLFLLVLVRLVVVVVVEVILGA